MQKIAKNLAGLFFEIFYPKFCVDCGQFGDFLCFDCASRIEYQRTSTCYGCGRITKNFKICPKCKASFKSPLSGVLIAAIYDLGPTRELIHHLKYSGIIDLSEIVGEMVAMRIIESNLKFDGYLVVPVPMYPKKELKRGYNQAELIARYVSKRLNLEGGLVLDRIRDTKTQINLTKTERLHNLSGAFLCADKELINNRNIILIDDVLTTGSTLNECARELKKEGAKNIFAAVVAKRV